MIDASQWSSYLRNPSGILDIGGMGFLSSTIGKQMVVALIAAIILFYFIIKTWQDTPFRRRV